MFLNSCSVRIVGAREIDNGYVLMRHGQQYSIQIRNEKNVPCDARVEVDGKLIGTFRIEAGNSFHLERPSNDHGRFTFYEPGSPEGDAAGLVNGDSQLGLVSVTFMPGYVRARPLRVQESHEHHHWHYWDHWHPWSYPVWPYYPWSRWTICGNTTVTYSTVSSPSATNVTYSSSNMAGMAEAPVNDTNDPVVMHASQASEYGVGGTGLSGHSNQEFIAVLPLVYDESQQVTINLRLVVDKKIAAVRPLVPVSSPVPPPVG